MKVKQVFAAFAILLCCARCAWSDAIAQSASSSGAEMRDEKSSLYELDSVWTSQLGKNVRLSDYRGHPVVITMFYSSCEYSCPITFMSLKKIQRAIKSEVEKEVRYLLITFDPDRDTVPMLKQRSEKEGFDPKQWFLLRGSSEDTREIAVALGIRFKEIAGGEISHSNIIVTLDREGRIVQHSEGLPQDVASYAKAIESLQSR